jgi:hypothetical protein
MNYPLSAMQTADLVENWGASYYCYPPVRIKKLWAEIPPEVDDVENLVKPVVSWLSSISSGDVVVLHGDTAAVNAVKKQLPDKILITPIIVTGGGTFKHVRFKVI